MRLNWQAVLAATLAYYVLGGLWFAPAFFGRRWEAAIGFARPAGWRAGARLYVVPLLGCLLSSIATAMLAIALDAHASGEALLLGLVVGVGYGTAIAATDAVSPRHVRPLTVAAVVGTYHVLGLIIVSLIVTLWR